MGRVCAKRQSLCKAIEVTVRGTRRMDKGSGAGLVTHPEEWSHPERDWSLTQRTAADPVLIR